MVDVFVSCFMSYFSPEFQRKKMEEGRDQKERKRHSAQLVFFLVG